MSSPARAIIRPRTRQQTAAARAALSDIAADDSGGHRTQLVAAWRALHRIDVDEVLTAALDDLGSGGHDVTVGSLEDLPDVIADAALLTRVLTSLLADALAHSPGDVPPEVTAASAGDMVLIRVAGCRHWTPEGLPVRLAQDVAEAMGDTLTFEETPNGGRTVVITLPAAAAPVARRPRRMTGLSLNCPRSSTTMAGMVVL